MEITGIEPVVPEGGGFTVHCITIDASSPFTIIKCYRTNLDVRCFLVKADAVMLGSVPGRLDPNSVSVLTRYLDNTL